MSDTEYAPKILVDCSTQTVTLVEITDEEKELRLAEYEAATKEAALVSERTSADITILQEKATSDPAFAALLRLLNIKLPGTSV